MLTDKKHTGHYKQMQLSRLILSENFNADDRSTEWNENQAGIQHRDYKIE